MVRALPFDSLRSLRAFDVTLACHERTFGSTGQTEGESNGEPGGNRTHNPQIKSLLLCQLSYRPERGVR